MQNKESDIRTVGVVGLGLLGGGITACLLSRGFSVRASERNPDAIRNAEKVISDAFETMQREFGLSGDVCKWRTRYKVVNDAQEFAECDMMIESVAEDFDVKQQVYDMLEEVLPSDTVVGCNASSFPVTHLQRDRKYPERFIGMHWGNPAYIKRYLEIIRGDKTNDRTLDIAVWLGERCGKEPSVLQRDIRGYISNRIQYALYREAFHLIERGIADVETIDRCIMNSLGAWLAFAGPFRWMDISGLPAYRTVMQELFPELYTGAEVPPLMDEVVESHRQNTSELKGFYTYSPEEEHALCRKHIQFQYDIKRLVDKYRPLE